MAPEGETPTPEPADKTPGLPPLPPQLPPLPPQQAAPPPPQAAFPAPIVPIPPAARNRRILLSLVVPNVVALLLLGMTAQIMSASTGHALTNDRSGTYIL